jgi:hypothetical protein
MAGEAPNERSSPDVPMATVLDCTRTTAPMPAQSFVRFMIASQVPEVTGRLYYIAKSC